ncbi:amino acid ABC transporter ATP-binding protein [Clostridium amazonitimonense]|uniref:amino acid ABC transporter ATP-binding protein n=1 Tax=Clostridium amazonitimonense TaxID=1499689 RepID=UPI0005097BF2|nr:amino acid ABC transporter ATP-binding protein [Clostridium amazonitimonense]
MLKVRNLKKFYGNKEVLKGISFEVHRGEVVSLIGLSGAGKTTILRCLNDLEKCHEGYITIEGDSLIKQEGDISSYSSKEEIKRYKRKIGMVFQNFNLFPHLNVIENIIEGPVSVLKMDKNEAEKKAGELLKRINLEEKGKEYPFQLSGGEKQRIAIVRACAMNPKVLCFDEPTSALDPDSKRQVGEIIKELAKKDNRAVLIITHDVDFAKNISDRIIKIREGKIV